MMTHDDHLLAVGPPERLGPPDLPRVPLHLEVLVAFRPAETEGLCVVSHKHRPVARVDVARAKVALFDTHSDG